MIPHGRVCLEIIINYNWKEKKMVPPYRIIIMVNWIMMLPSGFVIRFEWIIVAHSITMIKLNWIMIQPFRMIITFDRIIMLLFRIRSKSDSVLIPPLKILVKITPKLSLISFLESLAFVSFNAKDCRML